MTNLQWEARPEMRAGTFRRTVEVGLRRTICSLRDRMAGGNRKFASTDESDRKEYATSAPQESAQHEQILIICASSSRINAFSNIFSSMGFRVERATELPATSDLAQYGGIVHLAHTYDELCHLLNSTSTQVSAREWVFIEGEDGDFHCTIQLTPRASSRLESFVRSLWARFNIT